MGDGWYTTLSEGGDRTYRGSPPNLLRVRSFSGVLRAVEPHVSAQKGRRDESGAISKHGGLVFSASLRGCYADYLVLERTDDDAL